MRAAEAADFKGKAKTSIEILGARKLTPSRVLVIGAGRPGEAKDADWVNLGGYAFGQISARRTRSASILVDARDVGERRVGGDRRGSRLRGAAAGATISASI